MHTDSWICLPAAETETGAALRFAAERLMTRAEDLKLLFLISDGQPAGDGYYGTAAEADLLRNQAGIFPERDSAFCRRNRR